MRFKEGLLLLILFLWSHMTAAQDASYRLNLDTNTCVPLEAGLKPRPSTAVKDIQYIDQSFSPDDSFFKHVPICAKARTCLTSDRLSQLVFEGSLPKGATATNFLSGDFKAKAEKTCRTQVKANSTLFGEVRQFISKQKETYPLETRMAYEIVAEAKATTTDFLQDNKKAFQILRNCLEIDADFEKEGLQTEGRQKKYATLVKSKTDIQQGCSRIWEPTTEIAETKRQLTRMRQALLGISLLENNDVQSEQELLKLAEDLSKNQDALSKKVVLQHPEGPIPSRFNNLFWEDSAKNIEPAYGYEKEHFKNYLLEMAKRHPEPMSLKDRLLLDYYENISDNPLLIYFDSARPNSKEMLSAFEKKKKQQEKTIDSQMDDIEYLQFPVILTKVLESKPPEQLGDFCVLAQQLLFTQRDHKAALSKFVAAAALAEGGVAATFTKGLRGKAMATLFGAKYVGAPGIVYYMEKSTAAYNSNMQRCAEAYQDSGGICSALAIEKEKTAENLAVAMSILMGGISAASLLKQKSPAVLSGGK